jgi:hypothetical protein
LLVLGWANSQRSYPVAYDWARVGRVVVVVVAFMSVSQWVLPQVGLAAIGLRVLVAGLFPLALIALGAVTRDDLQRTRAMIEGRLGRGGEAGVVP